MLTLINTNSIEPPIAPIGLDSIAGAARRARIPVKLVDGNLDRRLDERLASHLASRSPTLVGISFRNVDDCFWPGRMSFLPELLRCVAAVRRQCAAPIVLGGVGYSIFPAEILARTGADYGIHGDGEAAVVALYKALQRRDAVDRVPGILWRDGDAIRANPPAWPEAVDPPTARDAVDNAGYFRRGGQIGVETHRGCPRQCLYCADPVAKGTAARLRDPRAVADEIESLLAQGVDVFHLCDSEFNLPRGHAIEVCREMVRRNLGERIRWYAYLAVVPFDAELARWMRRSGCAGINFTGDSASRSMLAAYRQPHGPEDLAVAVRCCRAEGIAVMLDLLLGGPGETPETIAESIEGIRRVDPDCAGAALGVRLYPHTSLCAELVRRGPLEDDPAIHRCYAGPIDLVQPTYYLSPAIGPRPGRLIRELIAGDPRFFEPADDEPETLDGAPCDRSAPGEQKTGDDRRPQKGYNYNDNQPLVDAIAAGARGAYWDILRRLRSGAPRRPG
jgi:tryptophan 2-C-methyltransferase